jgi:hypothetical protein
MNTTTSADHLIDPEEPDDDHVAWLTALEPDDDPPTPPDNPPEPDDDPPEPGSGEGSGRSPIRTYRGDQTEVEMRHVTGLRAEAEQDGSAATGVQVRYDGAEVTGDVVLTRDPESGRYRIDSTLRCDCGEEDCSHLRHADEAIVALAEARRIRPGLTDWERARGLVGETPGDTAHSAGPVTAAEPWSQNRAPFQTAYEQARARRDAGEAPVPFLTDNATGGLAARDGGRPFGVELEFELPDHIDRAAALQAIGRDLHAAGITPGPHQTGYHQGRAGFSTWRFEQDSTVDGEIVSPILYDEPESWRQIATVCDVVRRHGGEATRATGGHVHVGTGDFGMDVNRHSALLGLVQQHEDVLYRLAQNPARPAHRGLQWCTPNPAPSHGYRNLPHFQAVNRGHQLGLNFEAVQGARSDHVEFRMWDGSLDPGVIQAQVNLSLGLVDAASRNPVTQPSNPPREPIGTHRRANAHLRRGERLTGQAWANDTAGFRGLMDTIFTSATNRDQAAALFGVTRWQRAR